jgi:hypothetical protein
MLIGKNYSDFYLRKRDWEKLELMHEVLQVSLELYIFSISYLCFKEPASAKQTFSSSKEPSAFRTIPVLEFLKETWGNMADLPKFSEVEAAIRKGLESLEKYYGKVNDSIAYFLCLCKFIPSLVCDYSSYQCLVLNPNVKNAYALDKWESDAYAKAMIQLEQVVSNLPQHPSQGPG